ncbi:MAG: acetyltransferase [Syntrophobacteraceae bacterium]|jgi:sugar O-acyltransferase (sialic acid O-acetyltransferase NeuD family)
MQKVRVLILGAGGHGQIVADILLRIQDVEGGTLPIGFLDDCTDLLGREFLGVPVLGTIANRCDIPHDAIIVAIGENETRKTLFQLLRKERRAFALALHPRCVVAPDVQIGAGGMICAGAIVNIGAVIGEGVILNTGSTLDHHNHIGNYVHIAPGVHLGGEVEVGEGALIGIGATIMPRKRIGAWSIVGAGALVHQDIPDGVVAYGVPARVVRKILVSNI